MAYICLITNDGDLLRAVSNRVNYSKKFIFISISSHVMILPRRFLQKLKKETREGEKKNPPPGADLFLAVTMREKWIFFLLNSSNSHHYHCSLPSSLPRSPLPHLQFIAAWEAPSNLDNLDATNLLHNVGFHSLRCGNALKTTSTLAPLWMAVGLEGVSQRLELPAFTENTFRPMTKKTRWRSEDWGRDFFLRLKRNEIDKTNHEYFFQQSFLSHRMFFILRSIKFKK